MERFHQVQSAWRCLSDPTRRLLYDLRNYGRSTLGAAPGDSGGLPPGACGLAAAVAAGPTAVADHLGNEGEAKLLAMQVEQAKRDVENMQVQLEKVLRRERAARGVIVKKALYGDLRLHRDSLEEGLAGKRTIEADDLVGPVLEVVGPLQSLVEQHTIVLPGGASSSKADLPGFYNPNPLNPEVELSLYVLYEFKGHLHEVIVGDRETLSLPYRRHAIPSGKAPRGPFSPSNVAMLGAGGGDAAPAKRSSAAGAAQSPQRSLSAAARAPAPKVDRAAAAARALERAVRAYRLRRLQPPVTDPSEPSPREFLVVSLLSAAALASAMWWATDARHT